MRTFFARAQTCAHSAWRALICASLLSLSFSSPGLSVTKGPAIWMRLTGGAQHLQMDPRGNFLAYSNPDSMALYLLNIKTSEIFEITKHRVDQAFFFAPDGCRLFYREMYKADSDAIHSELQAYDCALKKSISLAKLPHVTGLLSFDPRDMRMHLFHPQGIHTQRLHFPGERLARWQEKPQSEHGKWIATQKGILWLTNEGTKMRKMQDDGYDVQSFDISPDGQSIVWATTAEQIYTSRMGKQPQLLAEGLDPRWHPFAKKIAFAAPRKLGHVTIDHDLKVVDLNGTGQFVTNTPGSPERSPVWNPNGKEIICTRVNSTDLFKIELR